MELKNANYSRHMITFNKRLNNAKHAKRILGLTKENFFECFGIKSVHCLVTQRV